MANQLFLIDNRNVNTTLYNFQSGTIVLTRAMWEQMRNEVMRLIDEKVLEEIINIASTSVRITLTKT